MDTEPTAPSEQEDLQPFIDLGQMLPELISALHVIEKAVPILDKCSHPEKKPGEEETIFVDDCARAAISTLGLAMRAKTKKLREDRLFTASMCIHLVEVLSRKAREHAAS